MTSQAESAHLRLIISKCEWIVYKKNTKRKQKNIKKNNDWAKCTVAWTHRNTHTQKCIQYLSKWQVVCLYLCSVCFVRFLCVLKYDGGSFKRYNISMSKQGRKNIRIHTQKDYFLVQMKWETPSVNLPTILQQKYVH